MNKFGLNKMLSGFSNENKNFFWIVIALFVIVTAYFSILKIVFQKNWGELIAPYALIVLLLLIVLWVGNYYTVIYENFHNKAHEKYRHMMEYKRKYTKKENKYNACEFNRLLKHNKHNVSKKTEKSVDKYFKHSMTPFSEIFNIEDQCNADHSNCALICPELQHCQLKTKKLKDNSLHDDSNKVPSVKDPLRYDGIYNIHPKKCR